ncbi:hypothetical protein C0Q88_23395 [Ralstonia pickettii]|uniref:Reverse transcriptase domain-containing protein n=1 Tax=Ralstonia pickettii TaxID=329 RepID=A0A2N4TKS4_RALPI|nr:hypothetical protein [Ralstonia pickettii]PLC40306.1 hypothetical protein C0Q88_23395 [Ralstonia pickettii]
MLELIRAAATAPARIRRRELRTRVGRYLASKDMQLLALRRAMSRERSHGDRNWEYAFYTRWLEYNMESRSMEELQPSKPCRESCSVHSQRKRSGGTRRLWKFGLCMTARQLLVCEALSAFYRRRPWSQMLFAGGLPPGVVDIKAALANPALTHYAIVDVTAFFDNVDLRGATCFLPLDRKVMENTLCVSPPADSARGRQTRYARICASEVVDVDRPLALPQGAASSPLIAYGLLEEALPLEDLEHLFPYADDLLILGESEEDVRAKVSRYAANLVRHPAGPLHLGPIEYGEITENARFEFIGVTFHIETTLATEKRRVHAEASTEKRSKLGDRLRHALADDMEARDRLLGKTSDCLVGFLAGVPTDDREQLVELACDVAKTAGCRVFPLVARAERFLTDSEVGRLMARYVGRRLS